jgi:FkbH-like protein
MAGAGEELAAAVPGGAPVKLVVWDLDDTIWEGTLLEGDRLRLRPGIADVVRTLDERGILQSIASRNDPEAAAAKLREFGLYDYFLFPQINWSSKSGNIEQIIARLGIGADTVLFVDDQDFERAEVADLLPEVRALPPSCCDRLLHDPMLAARFATAESGRRRLMYLEEQKREQSEREFQGPREDFLRSLDMRIEISPAGSEDLLRAEELIARTNQLNSTGITYSMEELEALRRAADHKLVLVAFSDRFGDMGKVGLVLLKTTATRWTVRLFLMSCRVMSRNVGSVIINHILGEARKAGRELCAEFRNTGRNRPMLIAYKFANFVESERDGDHILFRHSLNDIPDPPAYVKVTVSP